MGISTRRASTSRGFTNVRLAFAFRSESEVHEPEADDSSRAAYHHGFFAPVDGHGHLTVRQHSRRLGRKVDAFSKERDYLEHQLTLAFAYYHFVIPHRGLRQRLSKPIPTKGPRASHKKWRDVTPAVAAGLTDHVWMMDELLSFRVPPQRLW